MDLKKIKQLIHLVEQADISRFLIDADGTKIEIDKTQPQTLVSTVATEAVSTPVLPVPVVAAGQDTAEPGPGTEDPTIQIMTSQMVGTFYDSPSPEAAPYVKVGDRVAKGDHICIIEAMKLFNEIESDYDGVIEEILVKKGQSIEYGTALFRLRVSE